MGARRGGRIGLIVIVLIIFILVVAVGVIFLLNTVSGGGGTPSDGSGQAEVSPTPVPTTQLIVAKHDIKRGARLTQDDVEAMEWPLNISLPANAMIVGQTADEPGLEQVDGMIARVDILTNQPILSHMIASEKDLTLQASGSDAALLIPSGQVAVAFPLSRLAGVAYALRMGDHVDVMMSYRFVSVDKDFQTILPNEVGAVSVLSTTSGSETPVILIAGREENGPFGTKIMVVPSEDTQRPRQVTQLVIKNAIVMRVGDWPLTDALESIVVTPAPEQPTEGATPAPEDTSPTAEPPAAPDIITLIMSRQDALVLKYSLETGADIDFALRSALDNEVTDVSTDSVTLQYLMDFYDIVEPPLLPIAQEPRIDQITNPTGDFKPGEGGAVTPPPS